VANAEAARACRIKDGSGAGAGREPGIAESIKLPEDFRDSASPIVSSWGRILVPGRYMGRFYGRAAEGGILHHYMGTTFSTDHSTHHPDKTRIRVWGFPHQGCGDELDPLGKITRGQTAFRWGKQPVFDRGVTWDRTRGG